MKFETWDRDTLIKEIQTEFEVLTQLPGELHYSNEKLLEKDIKDLQNIYFDLKRKTDKNFYPQYEKELDRAYEFNAPEYDADFISWSKHPTWEIDEAIALLLGKDPTKVTWDKLKEDSPDFPLARKFNQLRITVLRCISSGELVEPIIPAEFLVWAKEMNLDIPEALIRGVNSFKRPVINLKEPYEQLNKQYTEALELISEQDRLIANLKDAQQQSDTDKPLGEKERQSLYKLIAAMAYAGYKYNPNDKKSATPKEISEDITKILSDNLDTDTVRKWLKKACEAYPNQN